MIKNSKIMKVLTKIGLSKEEVSIYLDLLENGNSNISEISRRTGLYRTNIYKNIPSLTEKGLITKNSTGNRALYSATSPESLENTLETLKVDLNDILPSLKNLQYQSDKKPTVRHIDGKKSVTNVFEDILTTLKKGSVYYRYSSVSKDFYNSKLTHNPYLSQSYFDRQKNKQLERLVITGEETNRNMKQELDVTVKEIPEKYDPFGDNITQIIYGDKVAFIDYEAESSVIIESKRFANFQKKLFLLLYRKL